MRALLLFIFVTVTFCVSSFAQTDTEFWFAAPDISAGHADTPIVLHIQTGNLPSTVNIYIGDMTTPKITKTIAANFDDPIDITTYKALLENTFQLAPNSDNLQHKAVHITATTEISSYYEVLGNNGSIYVNAEIWALKGKQALGTNFYIPGQNKMPTKEGDAHECFIVTATQDNTEITISNMVNINATVNEKTYAKGSTFKKILMRGDTYVVYDDMNDWASDASTLGGTNVTSTKPIAITISDDSVKQPAPSWTTDNIGDQLVPVTVVGEEYAVVHANDLNNDDNICIVTTTNNTNISIDGSLVYSNQPAGKLIQIPLSQAKATLSIVGDQPIYVYQVTGSGEEQSSALLPSVCEGSASVLFTINSKYTQETLVIVAEQVTKNSFTINPGGIIIPSSSFTNISGTTKCYAKLKTVGTGLSLTPSTTYTLANSAGKFQLGTAIKIGQSAEYGYFSSFSSINLGPDKMICPGDIVVLDAGTNVAISLLRWYRTPNPGDPETLVQSGGQTFTVTQTGVYRVEELGGCAKGNNTVSVKAGRTLALSAIETSGSTNNDGKLCEGSKLELKMSVLEVFPSYTWQHNVSGTWVTVGSSQNFIINSIAAADAGDYQLIGNDGTACSPMGTITITTAQLPVAPTATNQATCATLPIPTLTATATVPTGSILIWYDANTAGNIVASPTQSTVGSKTYYALSQNSTTGCESSTRTAVTLDINSLPVAEAGPASTLTCAITSLSLDGTGSSTGANITYSWTGGTITSGSTTIKPAVSSPGTYIITVKNTTTNCISADNVVVAQDATFPVAKAGTANDLSCSSLTQTLNGTGSSTGANITYAWSGGTITSGSTTLSPIVSAPATYTLSVKNTTTGCTSTDVVVVNQNIAQPTAEAGATSVLTCTTTTNTLNGNGSSTGANISYLWSGGTITSGSTTLSPVISTPATYTIKVTNTTNGCFATDNVVVTQDKALPTADAGTAANLTCTTTSITLDGTGSSTGANINYTWSGGTIASGSSSTSPIVTAAATYTIKVTNTTNGCFATDNVTVALNTTPPTAEAGTAVNLTCSATTQTLNASGSSVGANISYLWSGGTINSGSTTLNPVISMSATYTIKVTNTTNGCFATDNVVVSQDASLPVAEAGTVADLTCSSLTQTLNGTGSSVGANISYAWSGGTINSGASTLNPVVSTPATYKLTVTNTTTGCVSFDNVVLLQDITQPLAEAGIASNLTCTTTTKSLNGNGSSTGANISYLWSGGTITSGATTLSPVISAPATYTIKVTNTTNSCFTTDNVIVNQDITPPTAEAGTAANLTCTTTSISLNGTGSSTGGNIIYAWSGGTITSGASLINSTISTPATYTLKVTNSTNGCFATDNVVVNQDITPPIAEAGTATSLTCSTTTQSLNALGSSVGANISYLWSGGTINSGSTTLNPVISMPATYTLKVTNTTNGCFATDNVVVSQDASLPVAEAGTAADLTCSSLTQTLNGTGSSVGANINYAWSGGTINSGGTSLSPTVSSPATYKLTVTNTTTGCVSYDNVVLLQDISQPLAEAGIASDLTCTTTTKSLNGNGSSTGANISYLWSGGTITSGATTLSPVISTPATYTIKVTNATNGCFATDNVIVNQDIAPPTAEAGTAANLTCTTTSISLNGTGSSTGGNIIYAWSGGIITSGASSINSTITTPATYTLKVTNATNGCFATDNVVVNQDVTPPIAEAGTATNLTCTATTQTLNGTGSSVGANITYLWSGGTINSGSTTINPFISTPATYKIEVTNTTNGCFATDNVVVAQDASFPIAKVGAVSDLTCTATSQTLNGAGSSVGVNITYLWSGGMINSGSTTLNPVISTPATYTLTVTNTANNCSSQAGVVVSQDTAIPTANAGNDATLICSAPTLSLNGNESSSGSQFAYLWSSATGGKIDLGAATLDPIVSKPAIYTLTVTNTTNGCTNFDEVDIAEDVTRPIVNAGEDVEICIMESANLYATASGSAPFVYEWTPANRLSAANIANPTTTTLQSSSYAVTVTDAKGCSNSDTIMVKVKSFQECYNIVIPKYFTPNGDGVNDKWVIEGMETFPDSKINIYDRYGKFLVSYRQGDGDWDGKSLGKELQSDDYWYSIEVVPFGIFMRGSVNVKR